jgi:hypothetical protein
MAVMLNMMDSADGFPFTQHPLFPFPLHNQIIALAVDEGFSGMLVALFNFAEHEHWLVFG